MSARLAKLPGQVAVGNLQGDVTLLQFYDLNCPFCREAAADVDALVRADSKLKLVFVPYAVLSVPSVQGALIEVGASKMLTPEKFLRLPSPHLCRPRRHRRRPRAGGGAGRGPRSASARQGVQYRSHARCAQGKRHSSARQAGLAATPAYVIGGVAILGHPGLKSLQTVVAAMRACGKVVC